MIGPKFFGGCVLIGLGIGILIPFPYALLLAVPAGFIWRDVYLRRWPGE